MPAGDLRVTLVAFETRYARPRRPEADDRSVRNSQKPDDVENELVMWIPQLEAFLASLAFEAP